VEELRSSEILSAVEAAYAIQRPTHTWNADLLSAIRRALPGIGGGFACLFRADEGRLHFETASLASSGLASARLTSTLEGLSTAPPQWLRQRLAAPPRVTVECAGLEPAHAAPWSKQAISDRALDDINIVTVTLNGRGWLLSLGTGCNDTLPPAARRALSRIGSHVMAALSLWERLSTAVRSEECEATLEHARQGLLGAVRRLEEEQAHYPSEPERALRMQRGPVSGEWTLLDQFEQDGDRYLVARSSAPRTKAIEGLTPSERAVIGSLAAGLRTKEVAYTLGLSDTTIRVLLMRAVRKCGVKNRSELIDLWNTAPLVER
jgi:DNA-binding CsgD family transcriptional regulator